MTARNPCQGLGRPLGMSGGLALMQHYFTRTALRGYPKPLPNILKSAPKADALAQPPPQSAPPPAPSPESAPEPELAPEAEPASEHTPEPSPESVPAQAPLSATLPEQTYAATNEPAPPRKPRRYTPKQRGLLAYKQFWFGRESSFRVNGDTVTGTPLYIRSGTLRVINPAHSYYIPLHKIDYIRTDDGYSSVFRGERC